MQEGLVGQKIKEVRLQTNEEMEKEGWDRPAEIIVLEDGTKIFPSSDREGNNRGVLFLESPEGESGYLSNNP